MSWVQTPPQPLQNQIRVSELSAKYNIIYMIPQAGQCRRGGGGGGGGGGGDLRDSFSNS